MSNALFFSIPGHGHVNPSLPLVAELARRGHHIAYFITEGYRARVEAAGAVFQPYAPIQDDYFDARGLSGSVPAKVAFELITTAGEILPELLTAARTAPPDYVLFDGMCPWGYLLARILGVPAVASLALMVLPARALLSWDLLTAFAPVMFRDMGTRLEANRLSRKLGERYGVTPLGPESLLMALGDISISYTSSTFQPFASSVDKSVHFVGWSTPDTPSDHPFPFKHRPGQRMVYVSLGTLNNDDPAFFRMVIDAFTDSDTAVIITTGRRISDSFGVLPENIGIYDWVPQNEVLRQASLFITHAGLNSVHDGLYVGTPLLLVPQQVEQTYNALRVVELGAGLMLKKGQASVNSIRHLAARLLSEPQFKIESNRIGDSFRAAGGMALAADKIEALLRKPNPTRSSPAVNPRLLI